MKAWVVNIDNDCIYDIEDIMYGDVVYANTKEEARKKFFTGDSWFMTWENVKPDMTGLPVLKKEVIVERAPYLDGHENDDLKNGLDILRSNGWTITES